MYWLLFLFQIIHTKRAGLLSLTYTGQIKLLDLKKGEKNQLMA